MNLFFINLFTLCKVQYLHLLEVEFFSQSKKYTCILIYLIYYSYISDLLFCTYLSGDRLWVVQVCGCWDHDEDVLWDALLPGPRDSADRGNGGIHQGH